MGKFPKYFSGFRNHRFKNQPLRFFLKHFSFRMLNLNVENIHKRHLTFPHLYCPGAVDLVLLHLPLHPALGQQSVPHRPGRGVDEPEQSFCQTLIKELTDLSIRLLSSLEKAVPIFGANWSAASSSSPCVSIYFMKKTSANVNSSTFIASNSNVLWHTLCIYLIV